MKRINGRVNNSMKLKDLYNKHLTEALAAGQNSTPAGTPRPSRPRYEDPTGASSAFLDNDTDPDALLTQGIKDTFDQVQSHFNNKMTEFANDLSPERIGATPLNELKDKVSDVFDFVNKVQVYSKGKIDQISQDPFAIMAAFLASEPTKMAAFQELHKNLDAFKSSVTEIETQLSGLKGQIDSFVEDVEKVDADQAAQNIQSQQQQQDEVGEQPPGEEQLPL